MDKQKTEYAIISNAVDILSVQCAGNREKIIDLLTGYLWDEEEAGGIKRSTGKFELFDSWECKKRRSTIGMNFDKCHICKSKRTI